MGGLTAKALAQAAASVTLLVHPGEPAQRATWTGPSNRVDRRSAALAHARSAHPGAPLAWLFPDGSTVTID